MARFPDLRISASASASSQVCDPVTDREPVFGRAPGQGEAPLPAYSGETVWASHPLRVAAGVSVETCEARTDRAVWSIHRHVHGRARTPAVRLVRAFGRERTAAGWLPLVHNARNMTRFESAKGVTGTHPTTSMPRGRCPFPRGLDEGRPHE